MSEKNKQQSALGNSVTASAANVIVGTPGFRVEVKNVAEKIGGCVGGEKGREIGRAIDEKTKDVNIYIGF